MDNKFTLLELNKNIQDKINSSFPDNVWVIGEISELKVNRNGHCYLELIEKDVLSDHIMARSRATIWAFTYRMLRPYFESVTNRELSTGIKILVQVKVEYHEIYGLSLNITDIDPSYTLGDIALKKAEIIKKLEEDGILNLNQDLKFPLVPQKIAIISSETAAGYQDFIQQLESNTFEFNFYTKLFPSLMQGNKAEESIISSLEKIFEYEDFFDIVVLIRGGGSQADLSCFDSYELASNIAQFPLPILTGIGHDKDESIADIVSFKKLKTPTAVAEYIIEKTAFFSDSIDSIKERIVDTFIDNIEDQKKLLLHQAKILVPLVKNNLYNHKYKLSLQSEKLKNNLKYYSTDKYNHLVELKKQFQNNTSYLIKKKAEHIATVASNLKVAVNQYIRKEFLNLENNRNSLNLLKPENVLKRGYSITYFEGKALKNADKINKEDELKTQLFKGSIRSKVESKNKDNN